MTTLALGAVLALVGIGGALARAGDRPAAGPAGWFPDPSSTRPRGRRWDGGTWTREVVAGDVAAYRGRRFRGRFWGWSWVLPLLGAVAVVVGGGMAWVTTRNVLVLVALSVVAMALVGAAVYRFVDRQLGLHEAISGAAVVAVVVAGIGLPLLVARPLNTAVVGWFDLRVGLATVGPVEEMTKLLVPVGLLLLGRFRAPRAGIALGLASGIGFAVSEAGLYGWTTPRGAAPNLCGGTPRVLGADGALQEQIGRLVAVEPLHWLLTGLAVTVVWRQWHRTGPRLTAPVVGVVLLVMAVHSLNDSSAAWACDGGVWAVARALSVPVTLVVLYLLLRAAARRSLPPHRVGRVSRGWHPRRLGSDPVTPPAGVGDPDAHPPTPSPVTTRSPSGSRRPER